jgi:hypothetical protein
MNEEVSRERADRGVKRLTKQINREGIEFFVKQDFRNDVVLYYSTPNYSEPQRCQTTHNYKDMEALIHGLTYYLDLLERLNRDDELKIKKLEKEIHGEEEQEVEDE